MKVVYKIPRLKAQMQIEIALFLKKIFFYMVYVQAFYIRTIL